MVQPFTGTLRCGLVQLVVHQTLGRAVPGLIPVRGVVCCGLEQVTFPQLYVHVYSVHMFLVSRNKSSIELILIVEI